MTLVLANGAVIDTATPDAEAAFAAAAPELAAGLAALRDELRADEALAAGSPASSRSRTRPVTGCARCSTPTCRWRCSAGS